MKRLGFVGLGVMGEPMAGHLVDAGQTVFVWNRSAGKADRLAKIGATVCETLTELAEQCDVIITCVGRTEDVDDVVTELLKTAKPNALFIDHSTISPAGAVEIGKKIFAAGRRFVDAPITGGSMGAQKGTLTVFLGGSEADVNEAIEAIRPYSKRAERVGEMGAGQMMKMANQIAVGGALLGLCESLAFAKKAGLDTTQARDMISGGAGGSWNFENYGPKILRSDWTPGFSIKNQRKDFGYCHEAASGLGIQIPGTDLLNKMLKVLQDQGRGEDATAALYELYFQEFELGSEG